jgi:hypothetical protein
MALKVKRYLCIATIALVLALRPLCPSESTGSISGTIYDSSGRAPARSTGHGYESRQPVCLDGGDFGRRRVLLDRFGKIYSHRTAFLVCFATLQENRSVPSWC